MDVFAVFKKVSVQGVNINPVTDFISLDELYDSEEKAVARISELYHRPYNAPNIEYYWSRLELL